MTKPEIEMTTLELLQVIGKEYVAVAARKEGDRTMFIFEEQESEQQQAAVFELYAATTVGWLQPSKIFGLWELPIHILVGEKWVVEYLFFKPKG